jgi:hypothetical protein
LQVRVLPGARPPTSTLEAHATPPPPAARPAAVARTHRLVTGQHGRGEGQDDAVRRRPVEYRTNATDGDAGLQVFLDGEPWRAVSLYNPAGRKLMEITAKGPLKNYGLTELFSESSEPSFDVFPFEQFKQLFPEGVYTFRGKTIDGKQLLSTARLSGNQTLTEVAFTVK